MLSAGEALALALLRSGAERFAAADANTPTEFCVVLSAIETAVIVANKQPTSDMVEALCRLIGATRNNITA